MGKNKELIIGSRARLFDLILEDSQYMFSFDTSDGIIEGQIVSKDGINYSEALGLSDPCNFDDIIGRTIASKKLKVAYALDSSVKKITREGLIKAYKAGKRRLEIKICIAKSEDKRYNRLVMYLDKDKESGHIICYVLCQDITAVEEQWLRENATAQGLINDTDQVLSCAGVGIWYISLLKGEKPKMIANAKMYELMGIKDTVMTEEEVYDFWFGRIKKSALPSVLMSVTEMARKGMSENTYIWNHPELGERYVRCGGTAERIKGKGYIFRGYHSDVTDIKKNDLKQKQMLADALEETRKQKELLQEALDNYKQADYDRRRDFLTGLRNRQDMFEMLNDSLSDVRNNISAMFMMDIDNFKKLNDHYGHTMGDECLKKIGAALNEFAEDNNMYFYRYGGEEVLGIAVNEHEGMDERADRLVKLIYDLNIKREDSEYGRLTVSLGYTTDTSDLDKMIDKADAAMYRAKTNGKNQAVSYERRDLYNEKLV